MPTNDFLEIIPTRFNRQQLNQIDSLVASNRVRYFNRSHFVRIAVLKLIREEKEKFK